MGNIGSSAPEVVRFDSYNTIHMNQNEAKQMQSELAKGVSECMLKQSLFTIAGIGLGAGIGYRTKNFGPLIIASGVGTCMDFIYGQGFSCRAEIQELNKAKEFMNKFDKEVQ